MFYALGSLLFIFALMAAFAVMAQDVARYRHAMMAALRGLSMDGWNGSQTADAKAAPVRAVSLLPAAPTRQAVA